MGSQQSLWNIWTTAQAWWDNISRKKTKARQTTQNQDNHKLFCADKQLCRFDHFWIIYKEEANNTITRHQKVPLQIYIRDFPVLYHWSELQKNIGLGALGFLGFWVCLWVFVFFLRFSNKITYGTRTAMENMKTGNFRKKTENVFLQFLCMKTYRGT